MAFPADTKVLTNRGWKKIEDVGGHDRVLTRNFLGDAQFTKPFAIKKKSYSGEIISGGSYKYQFKVTPDHEIVYTDKHGKIIATNAKDVPAKRENKLKHKSRYSPDGYLTPQKLKYEDRAYTIDNLDWYKLVGFVLRRGGMDGKRTRLTLALDKDNVKKDMDLICPVLDRMNLKWTFTEPNLIVISQKYNIAYKLSFVLGSKTRRKMYVPDKMIYNSSVEEGRALIEMFIRTSRRDGEGIDTTTQFATSNTKLIDSLEILGLLCGYTISRIVAKPAGTKVGAGVTKRDSYAVYVRKSVNEISIIRKDKINYSGKVYEIDMFEDQLLIKEDNSLPIWMKPK